jgi:flagellar basal-body rod protein FlgB
MLREILTGTTTFDHLKRGLDASALRHSVISDNIANVNQPGHSPQAVRFESEFKAMVEHKLDGAQTHPAHLPVGRAPILPEPRMVGAAADDIESQMVEMVENTTKYTLLVRLLDGKYQGLLLAIRGRY